MTRTLDDHDDANEPVETGHLEDVEDGCGCTEIWEHLSESRDDGEAGE